MVDEIIIWNAMSISEHKRILLYCNCAVQWALASTYEQRREFAFSLDFTFLDWFNPCFNSRLKQKLGHINIYTHGGRVAYRIHLPNHWYGWLELRATGTNTQTSTSLKANRIYRGMGGGKCCCRNNRDLRRFLFILVLIWIILRRLVLFKKLSSTQQ